MESNEQTGLTGKIDRLIDGEQMTASWDLARLEHGGIEKKGKGLMDMDNSVVTARGRQV